MGRSIHFWRVSLVIRALATWLAWRLPWAQYWQRQLTPSGVSSHLRRMDIERAYQGY